MRKTTLIIFLFTTALFAGCKEAPPGKGGAVQPQRTSGGAVTEIVHRRIARYNQLLSEGYKSINMTSLQEVTTPELAEKAYYHMAAIGEGNSRMVSELKKLDFVETLCSSAITCRVVTRELWDYSYEEIKSGKKVYEVKDYLYDVRYLLESRQGRWVITEITATGEDRKEVPSWKELLKKR